MNVHLVNPSDKCFGTRGGHENRFLNPPVTAMDNKIPEAKNSGSPVRMRTYEPFVHRLGVKWLVFSSNISLQPAPTGWEGSLLPKSKTVVDAQGISCVFLCIFLLRQRETRAMCCSCRRSCAWACKGSSLVCVRSMCGVLRLLQYLHSVTVVSCEHVANRYLQDRSSSARRNRFFLRFLFRVELCGSNGNDVGVFEHARS
jgi:hypothetical protein